MTDSWDSSDGQTHHVGDGCAPAHAVLAQEKCKKCDGCGQVADSDDQEPWSFWMDLPVKSAMAVMLGLVKPITCPKCQGAGHA